MRKIFILFAQLSFFYSSFAQAPNWLWAKSMGGVDFDDGHCIALDTSNNIYMARQFKGTTDFDPSAIIYNLTLLSDKTCNSLIVFVSLTPTPLRRRGAKKLDVTALQTKSLFYLGH